MDALGWILAMALIIAAYIAGREDGKNSAELAQQEAAFGVLLAEQAGVKVHDADLAARVWKQQAASCMRRK